MDIRFNESSDNEEEKVLLDLSKNANKKYTGYIQWFTFMDTLKIDGIKYRGQTGRILKDKTYIVSLDSTASETMKKVSYFFKNIPVNSLQQTINTFINPRSTPDGGWMGMPFKTGVIYNVMITENSIYVYSNDLGYTLVYDIDEDIILDFYDFMLTLDDSTVEVLE